MESVILKGIPKIINNAESLFNDAELLCLNNRNERAYSLYQLSIEEIAKAFFLFGEILFNNEISNEKWKKTILDHKYKSHKSIGIEYMLIELIKKVDHDKYEELLLKSFEESKTIDLLNKKKNHGFYTSLINDEFLESKNLITTADVKSIRDKASIRIYFGKFIIIGIIRNFDKAKEKAL